jgi:hypothetical protein
MTAGPAADDDRPYLATGRTALTGHIDEGGRRQTLKAADVLLHRYDSPEELARQRAHRESWMG